MKTVIITGGARGIGRELCRAFAEKGYNVVINYNKSENHAESLYRELKGMGLPCEKFRADVRIYGEACDMAEFTLKKFGGINVLINNAGIALQKLFCDVTDEEWDNLLQTNINGVLNCTKAVLPYMISQKSGNIINISSIWGLVGASCEVHYSTTKAAIVGLTKALAKEVGPSGICVNCIAPGIIDTDMTNDLSPEDRQALIEQTPLMRTGMPKDVAAAAIYLAEDSFITGQVISPNGGFVI